MAKRGQEAVDKNHVPGTQGEIAVSLASLQAGGPAVEPVAWGHQGSICASI